MKKLLFFFLPLLLAVAEPAASGQEFALSTNLADYAELGTLNISASYGVSRHWSLTTDLKYNPFTFKKEESTLQLRQRSLSAGTRYWPWHIYSGWWLSGKVMYQEYNTGGIFSPETREGDRIGMSLGGGYSHMIGKRLNIEFGAGIWSGMDWFTKYSCPVCGNVEASGKKVFILPSDIIVALSYIF